MGGERRRRAVCEVQMASQKKLEFPPPGVRQ